MWGDRIYPFDIRENPVNSWDSQFKAARLGSVAGKPRPSVTRVATAEWSGDGQGTSVHVRQHDRKRFVYSCNHNEKIFQSLTTIESNLLGPGPSVSRILRRDISTC